MLVALIKYLLYKEAIPLTLKGGSTGLFNSYLDSKYMFKKNKLLIVLNSAKLC